MGAKGVGDSLGAGPAGCGAGHHGGRRGGEGLGGRRCATAATQIQT